MKTPILNQALSPLTISPSELDTSRSLDSISAMPSSWPGEKMRLSATAVIDPDHKVRSLSEAYYDIYGTEPGAPASTAEDLLKSRVKAGWFALSEAFSSADYTTLATERVRRNVYYRDFHISPTGAVIDVTHCKDPATGIVTFDFIPTGARVETAPGQGVERRALLALRDLGAMHMLGPVSSNNSAETLSEETCASVLVVPRTGAILITDPGRHFSELADIHNIDDLPFDLCRPVELVSQSGRYIGTTTLRDGRSITLNLTQQHFYEGGPVIVSGSIGIADTRITCADIRRKIPGLTEKEAEILFLLAQGKTLKEAAAITGKAQVTATLQARSGLMKSGARSMNALLARINRIAPR